MGIAMVICLCKAVSDKTVRKLVQSGATTLREVMSVSRAGSDCGSCVCQLKEIIEEAKRCQNQGEGQGERAASDQSSFFICSAK